VTLDDINGDGRCDVSGGGSVWTGTTGRLRPQPTVDPAFPGRIDGTLG
jgi:hypothetical protein